VLMASNDTRAKTIYVFNVRIAFTTSLFPASILLTAASSLLHRPKSVV
jgi:hypothetical protein